MVYKSIYNRWGTTCSLFKSLPCRRLIFYIFHVPSEKKKTHLATEQFARLLITHESRWFSELFMFPWPVYFEVPRAILGLESQSRLSSLKWDMKPGWATATWRELKTEREYMKYMKSYGSRVLGKRWDVIVGKYGDLCMCTVWMGYTLCQFYNMLFKIITFNS